MHKALDVLGLPVVCTSTGDEIGAVRDILCDTKWRVQGVVLQYCDWFHEGKFIPLEKIRNVGSDSVTVTGEEAIQSMRMLAETDMVGVFSGKTKLKGKNVVTTQGNILGKIEDVYFSLNWDKLVGYELSEGWLTDVTEGRKRVMVSPSIQLGKDALVIPDSNHILM
jgi:uncharacterized protein YrrD